MMLVLAILATVVWLFHEPDVRPPEPGPPPSTSGPVGTDGIIGTEHRKLLADFVLPGAADQAAMRASLAATQRLSCGASASLVYRNDVIVFSSHQLLDHGKPDPDLVHCFFVVARTVNGVPREDRYPLLLETLDHGVLRAAKLTNDDVGAADDARDWSVVRLARPVAGIEPYRLPDEAEPGPPGTAVVTVSETTDNWKGSSKPADRLAQTCHAIAAEPGFSTRFPAVMHLDCDVGGGASGGAILGDVASGAPRYLGTTIAYTGNHCREAGPETCFSIGRRLDADLAARIRGTTALGTGPEDEAARAAQRARLVGPRDGLAAAAAAELAAPFPTRDDPVGREVAALRIRIADLTRQGHAGQTNPLFLQAYRALHDPNQDRPEWPRLWLENGNALLLQGRRADAFQCFRAGYAVADAPLKSYLRLRMAQTAADADERGQDLREAYLAGGDALFRTAGAEAELSVIAAQGLPTTPNPDDSGD